MARSETTLPSFEKVVVPGVAAADSTIHCSLRALPGAGYFALLALAESVWAAGYLLQSFSTNLPDLLFWNSVQFTAVLAGTLGYLGFAFYYTGRMIRFARSAMGGAVVSGLIGNAVEKGNNDRRGVEVTVRLEGGRLIAITQEKDEEFRVGDRVRILSGQGATRVSRY